MTTEQDTGYAYDPGGIRDKAPANHSAEGPGDLLKQFSYDPLKRLLTATGRESTAPSALPLWDAGIRAHDHTATNTYTRAYTYDKVGNVLQEQHTADGHAANGFTKTFNYHPAGADNRLVSYEVGGLTFPLTYDVAGNQLKETTSRFHYWDQADLLRYFEVRAGAPSVWAHYFYDSAGTRVKKVVGKLVGGSIRQEVTVYIDGVFEETYVQTNGTIDPGRHYNTLHVMDGRSRIATIRVGNDVEDPTPAVKFNLEDHLGTSSVVLDQYGGLINREEYYPFGDTCFGAFAKKQYRYVGKEKDNESGLYYYGARYYAGWMCRFISVDPLAASYAHLNPYNYAGNKPIGDLDIDGMQSASEKKSANANGTGDKRFDKAASKAIKDNPNSNITINVTNIDGHVSGSISVDGKTANYTSENGFTDENGASLIMDDAGSLSSPTSILSAMPNPDGELAMKVPSTPTLQPTENSQPPSISASEPTSSTPKEEPTKSYNEDKKSGIQNATEGVETKAGWADSVVGAADETLKGSKTARNKLSKGIYEGSKWLKGSTKGWGSNISEWTKGIKPGKIFQGIKRAVPRISKFLGKAAKALTISTIAWEVLTDTWDAHTIVNALVFTGLLVVGAVLGPVAALIGGIALAVIWTVGDVDNKIDQNYGRKAHPEWYPDRPLINPARYSF